MPANRKPKAWNLKPQMTAAPEMWDGAVVVYPFWEGVGRVFPTSMTHDLFLNSGAAWRKDGLGTVVRSFGVNADRVQTTEFPDLGNNFSIAVRGSSAVNNQTSFAPLSANGKAGGARDFKFLIQDNGSGGLRAQIGAGGGVNAITGNFSYSAGEIFLLVATYDGSMLRFYVDGVLNDSVSSNIATFTTSFFTAAGNESQTGGSLPWNGDVSFVAAYNRAINEAEIFRLSRDPFAMLRPAGF